MFSFFVYISSSFFVLSSKDFLYIFQFGQESIKETESMPGRCLIVACDGANGQAVRLLGLSDEFEQHSCSAYGAVAALERMDQPQVPLPERRVQNLHFDLAAYGSDSVELDGHQGFSLKIFGSSRNRYMSLVIPKSESPLVKTLRVVLDRSVSYKVRLKCLKNPAILHMLFCILNLSSL